MYDLFNIPDWDHPLREEPSPVGGSGAERETPASSSDSGAARLSASSDALPRKAGDGGYFNTTHLTGRDLADATKKAEALGDLITLLYAKMPDDWKATPSKVKRMLGGEHLPTSVRRAMTVLTNRGVLVKTSETVIGPHNAPEHYWRRAVPVRRAA